MLGGYFDMMYARISFLYVTNAGNPFSDPPLTGNLQATQLDLNIIAKLPIVTKFLTLWSGIGVGLLFTLFNNIIPNAAFSNSYILLALGAEFKIANLFTIGPGFTLNYSVTPDQFPPGDSHTQALFQFTMTVGFAF